MSKVNYGGYWLYHQELEKFHPAEGRVANIYSKTIVSDEALLASIKRAAQSRASTKTIHTTYSRTGTQTPGPDNNTK